MKTDLTLDEAIKIAKCECKDPYALSYLNAIPNAIEMQGTEALKTQLIYILNNMKYWKGDNARKVKNVFNKYIKTKK